MQDNRQVIIQPSPFRSPKVMLSPEGLTIKQMIDRMYDASGVPAIWRDYAVMVEVNGSPVMRDRWHLAPITSDHIMIHVPVHGGGGDGEKDTMRTILSIVVVVVSIITGQYYGAAFGASMGISASMGTSLLSAAVMTAGMLLVNAIAPIRSASSAAGLSSDKQDYKDSPTYSLQGSQNQANPFGPIPVVLGKHRMYPPYGAHPYTEILGNDEYLRMLFIWGYGPLKIEDVKIGDTLLSSYSDYEVEHREGRADDEDITLVPSAVYQDGITTQLVASSGRLVRAAKPGVDEISVDISFPRGCVEFNDEGTRITRNVRVLAEYREIGTEEWTAVSDSTTVNVAAKTETWTQTLGASSFYGIYVTEDGIIQVINGSSVALPEKYMIGYFTVIEPVEGPKYISVVNLSPAGVTGMICSNSGPYAYQITAGTVYRPPRTFDIYSATTSVLRYGSRWLVDRTKNYEVALTRITADSTGDKVIDEVYWATLRGFRNDPPVSFPFPLAMTAIRIRASEQLQGVLDSFNGIVTSYATAWDGDEWTGEAVTQNPAALYRLALTHPANARQREEEQINDAGLGDWYDFCDDNGYEFNMIRDFRTSVWEVLADIAAAGRASPTLTDGVWGVVADTGDQPVIQHITPRNSWGFSAEKTLYHRPHAFRVPFTNEDQGYEKDERIVYDDGYNESNATQFESIEFPGITSPDLIWKFGRFHIAQARLRPEQYTINMDFEHLVCRRGSKVRVSHDIPLWGSGWGRVKSLVIGDAEADPPTDPEKTYGVILDDVVVMAPDKGYACRFRLADADNTSLCLSVNTEVGETNTLTFSTPLPTASGPQEGDLAMFGEASRESVECLVKSIERASDYTAKLTLVDAAPEVYDADTGTIPPFDSNITGPMDITKLAPAAPTIINIQSGTIALEIFGGTIRARILATIFPQGGTIKIGSFKVRYREQGETAWLFADATPENLTAILTGVTEGITYEMQAQAISQYGAASIWSAVYTHTVIGQGEIPGDVAGLSANIIGANAYLSWNPNTDVDLSHYRIRWSAVLSGATWAASIDIVERVGKPATSVTVPAMVGTYLIKAVDYQGNESETAGAAITNIARVAGLNFVEAVEQPPWDGTGDGVVFIPDLSGLILESPADLYDIVELYSIGDLYVAGGLNTEGTYDLADVVDLTGIFTVRATAEIDITGTNLLSDLYTASDLYSMPNLYDASEGQYSVSLEIRTTNDDPDDDPEWGEWNNFLIGDYTARAFQFRLRLKGTAPAITPIVYGVYVQLDMPDRVIGFSATVPVEGARITFSPAFYVAPEIGISVSDGQEGDKYTISSKDATGFDIAFTNGGSAVERDISGIAKAYGELEE